MTLHTIRRLAPRMFRLVAAVMLLMIASVLPALGQCEMCKKSLTESVEGGRIAQGINKGIVLLLVVPAATFGTVGLLIFRARSREL